MDDDMPTVYLAGPMEGCNDHKKWGWRNELKTDLKARGWTVLMPEAFTHHDFLGMSDDAIAEKVVGSDMGRIDEADLIVAYYWQKSTGTAMELMYAKMKGKRIIVLVPNAEGGINPWLRYAGDTIAIPTVCQDTADAICDNWRNRDLD